MSPPPGELPNNILVFLRGEFPNAGFEWLHNRFVLVVCVGGEGDAVVNGRAVGLDAGKVLLIRPYQSHRFDTSGRPVSWLFITFELKSEGRELPASATALPLDGTAWALARHAVELFGEESARPGAGAYGLSLTIELLLNMLAKSSPLEDVGAMSVPPRPEELLVERLNRHLQQHLGESANNARLARSLGVSCGKLRSTVRRLVGVSLAAYVRRMRIRMASSMLVDGRITVGEAAERCGFNSIYAFSRCFKHVNGMSPSEFVGRYSARR